MSIIDLANRLFMEFASPVSDGSNLYVTRERTILTHLRIDPEGLVVDAGQERLVPFERVAITARHSNRVQMVLEPDTTPRTFHFIGVDDEEYLLRPGNFVLPLGGAASSWGPGIAVVAAVVALLHVPRELRHHRTVRSARSAETTRFSQH